MRSAGRVVSGLHAGGLILTLLAALALLAPLLATDRPWIARGPAGRSFPAFRQVFGDPGPLDLAEIATLRAPVPRNPNAVDLEVVLEPPSLAHPMGTDGLGRDLAARVVHGARVSISVGLLTAAISLLVGLPLGAIAGYRGGLADSVVSRGVEAVLCVPALLLALALLAAGPAWLDRLSDPIRLALVLSLTGWTSATRYLRGEFLRLRESEMVQSARAAGAGHFRIAARHLLPSALAPVLVMASFSVGGAILLEAALSFLGLGVRPPTPTWGGLLQEARHRVDTAWWLAVFPGLFLFLAVLGCNLLGEGLRDALDPRSRRTR